MKTPPSTLPFPVNHRQAPRSEKWPDSFLALATGSAPPRPSLHLPRLKEEEVEEVVEEGKGPNTSTNSVNLCKLPGFFKCSGLHSWPAGVGCSLTQPWEPPHFLAKRKSPRCSGCGGGRKSSGTKNPTWPQQGADLYPPLAGALGGWG